MLYVQKKNPKIIKFSKAFTVIEVGVIVPIVLVVIGAFILTIINFTAQAVEARKNNAIAVDTQNAINRLASDVSDSLKFLATNDFTVVSPQGSGNNTVKFANNSIIMILQTPLTQTNPRTAALDSDNFVYRPSSPLPCSDPNVATNSLATYNIVYFASNNSIFRRSMMMSNWSSTTNACGGSTWQKPTCAAGQSGTNCSGGVDEKISQDYLMTVQFAYYEQDQQINTNSTNTGTDSLRQENLDKATSVKVTLNASKTIDGELQTYKAERILPLN